MRDKEAWGSTTAIFEKSEYFKLDETIKPQIKKVININTKHKYIFNNTLGI